MAYTAAYLASMGTFILRAPPATLTTMFESSTPEALAFIPLLSGTAQYRPRDTTIRLCQRLMCVLKQPRYFASEPVSASPAIVPYALCLLVRFRLLCAWWQVDDDELLSIAVFVAFKFLNDWAARRRYWAVALEMSEPKMGVVERGFLQALQYRVWVQDGEFARWEARMEGLWGQVLERQMMEARSPPPNFVVRLFGML